MYEAKKAIKAAAITASSSHSSCSPSPGPLRKPSSKRKLDDELSRNNAKQVPVAHAASQDKSKKQKTKM